MSKNVLFDLDGTLVDSLPGIQSSILYAINNRGYEVDENVDIKSRVGPPMREIFSGLLSKLDGELIDEVVEIYREDYKERGLLKTTLFDDIFPVLSGLHECGCKLYIVTSKRQRFAEEIIRNLNLLEYFEAIYGTPSDGAMDNKEDLLRYVLHHRRLSLGHTVFVGDRKEDVIAASINKITSIGVRWGYANINELEESGANYICEQPNTLQSMIHYVFKECPED